MAAIALAAALLMRSQDAPRNVLIITIDTLRADAPNEADTPALMELARRGTRFVSARTPVPLTLPAHASLLTGSDPRRHGLRTNTAPALTAHSIAEDFFDAGYSTAAFVASSVLHERYRLNAGFQHYEGPPLPTRGSPTFRTIDAIEQVRRFRSWMKARRKDRPYFAWVHLWEPHAPYREYAGDGRRAGTSAETDSPRQLYAGEVRKADWAVEQLLGEIDPETTIVFVTSDHGESFGEHGESTHGHLCFGATMDIPMILAGPGVASGETEERVCDLTDVAPTLRALCGVGGERGGGGSKGLLDLPDKRVVIGESLYSYGKYRWAQQTVAYDGTHSLVDGGPDYELYDRASDPGETRPLVDDFNTRQVRMDLDRALVDYRAEAPAGERTPYSSTGSPYGTVVVDGFGFSKPKENRARPSVRARLGATEPIMTLLNTAIVARHRALAEKVLKLVKGLEAMDPGNPALALARGRALLLVLGRKHEALEAFQAAIARGYPRRNLQGLIDRCK